MKLLTLATLVGATISTAAAQPHGHQHAHGEKRDANPSVVVVEGPTVVVYVLNGELISESDVNQGIANGTLVWADSGALAAASSSSSSDVTITTTTTILYTPTPAVIEPQSASSAPPPVLSSSSAAPVVSVASTSSAAAAPPSPVAAVAVASSSPGNTNLGSATGVNAVFPDGQLSCSIFPSAYGALNLNWLGLGGWAGIQKPASTAGGFANILTMTSNICTGPDCCAEGAYCSYACPPGYQKSQWPAMQGSTGQSVGGILCQNGKLHLTNPSLSRNLCVPGTNKVNVMVKNTMSTKASVCRTDYPGTEGETIPLAAAPGSLQNLTCPDGDDYYQWQGMKTSAQYYVNPAGVDTTQACQWGNGVQPWGNWAPLNLGVGYSAGFAWLSIFQNSPTTNEKLDFTVEIVGENGGANMNGKCRYSNGQYCSGDNYQTCSSTTGCTVSFSSCCALHHCLVSRRC